MLPPLSLISTFANTVHIGHSTGGGEATRYVARYGDTREVAKMVLIGAVPPIMVKTAANPHGLPIEVLDGLRKELAANRAAVLLDFASGPFYGYNRPGAKASQGVIENWWRQGMMGSAKGAHDGIKAFSETDFTETSRRSGRHARHARRRRSDRADRRFALLSSKLLKNGTLKVYERFPHGMCTTHADVVNPAILAFIDRKRRVAGGRNHEAILVRAVSHFDTAGRRRSRRSRDGECARDARVSARAAERSRKKHQGSARRVWPRRPFGGHTHPASAFIYATVLEGAIASQVNDGPVKVYKAGESFSEMPGDRHAVSANASRPSPPSCSPFLSWTRKTKS
jgi:quercetin dioxygenase-like cupin family protein